MRHKKKCERGCKKEKNGTALYNTKAVCSAHFGALPNTNVQEQREILWNTSLISWLGMICLQYIYRRISNGFHVYML